MTTKETPRDAWDREHAFNCGFQAFTPSALDREPKHFPPTVPVCPYRQPKFRWMWICGWAWAAVCRYADSRAAITRRLRIMEAGVGSAAELITGQGKECDLEVLKIAIGLLEENKVSS